MTKMLDKDQEQNVGEGGTAVQAAGDIIINKTGLTYDQVRQVAMDVFRANFFELAGDAKEVARKRAEEVTEEFLAKLKNENPSGLSKSQDPDFQHALFAVQKEYARSGDKELGDLLVDLLVDRSKQDKRNILQIVLNESINTASKLTESQLAALAIIFLFRFTKNHSINNHNALGGYLDNHVSPFCEKIVKNNACYQHLVFSGCGSIELAPVSLEKILAVTYPGIFMNGFDKCLIKDRSISVDENGPLFTRCLNDPSLIQVNSMDMEILEREMEKFGVSAEDAEKLKALFKENQMSEDQIRAKCIELRPCMDAVFDTWSGSEMKRFTLTSVGMAIGHANIKRFVGEFADLSIWIN